MIFIKTIITTIVVAFLGLSTSVQAQEAKTEKYVVNLYWSYFSNWYQWEYAKRAGIVDKWADKMGVKINIVNAKSYPQSITDFRNGTANALTTTNGDAWSLATSNDVIFLITGDFSNGADVLLSTECNTLEECRDKKVQFRYDDNSVSDMLIYACYKPLGTDIRALKSIQAAESDIVLAFKNGRKATAATWSPFVEQIEATDLCNSSKFPGYIVDGLVVSADMPLNAKIALVGINYDVMKTINDDKVLKAIADIPGDTLKSYKLQRSKLFMLNTPIEGVTFMSSDAFIKNMETRVRDWLFTTGYTTRDIDGIGVKFPNGKIIGNSNKVRLTFDSTVMQLFADGKVK